MYVRRGKVITKPKTFRNYTGELRTHPHTRTYVHTTQQWVLIDSSVVDPVSGKVTSDVPAEVLSSKDYDGQLTVLLVTITTVIPEPGTAVGPPAPPRPPPSAPPPSPAPPSSPSTSPVPALPPTDAPGLVDTTPVCYLNQALLISNHSILSCGTLISSHTSFCIFPPVLNNASLHTWMIAICSACDPTEMPRAIGGKWTWLLPRQENGLNPSLIPVLISRSLAV